MKRQLVALATAASLGWAGLVGVGAPAASAGTLLGGSGKGAPRSAVIAAQSASLGAAAKRLAATAPLSIVNLGCGGTAAAGRVRCLGKTLGRAGRPLLNTSPSGMSPADIQSAYKLPGLNSSAGSGQTVAIVDAQDDPTAEADLATYRATYGLPPCTTASGCFQKVNQSGAPGPYPAPDFGWAEEISLDLDTVSATCPNCKIVLVEANSPQDTDLMAAVDTAASFNPAAISNSYGGSESATTLGLESHLKKQHVAITAGAGDWGYGVSWPASSPWVTAVGGTTLTHDTSARGWSETVWSGTGSGCSANEPKQSWQTDTGCSRRTVADVAAVADPQTGLAVYDSYNGCGTDFLSQLLCPLLISLGLQQGALGWLQVGGTSLGTPLIASVYALAGNSKNIQYNSSYPYGHAGSLFDVTSGSNGSCGGSYLCTAGKGYDGPTGLGTPNGVGAF